MPIIKAIDTPVVRIGTIDSVIINCYRSTPTIESLDQVQQVQTDLLTKFPKVATMAIAGAKSSLLRIDEKVRTRSIEMSKIFEGRVRGAAIVIATKGLSAVMARSFMSGYLLLSKQAWPMQTFSSIDAAAVWLRGLPGNDARIDLSEIEAFERGE
ncbi:MAG: hypothetical protein QM817_16440 [Archangium sp.]